MMTAFAPTVRPSRSFTPRTQRVGVWGSVVRIVSRLVDIAVASSLRRSRCWLRSLTPIHFDNQLRHFRLLDVQIRLATPAPRASSARYCCLSHCARGDHTAGPRDVFSRRNWMPTASVTSPMMPPSASTSRTRCPLAMPPMAGLHDICAMRSTFSVKSAVFRPMRAAAIAASQPAWPAPTTTTS